MEFLFFLNKGYKKVRIQTGVSGLRYYVA
ncbi:hypothetical protein Goarm_007099 [Gossypium armourianum]|uniref:Uncharacterized protein n=1 Tax=Gossypium armourianum TaxID=34283 RepID=A0A7J9JK28_9ROSI|nr:hypothetical protein [Gossypium armourianum]